MQATVLNILVNCIGRCVITSAFRLSLGCVGALVVIRISFVNMCEVVGVSGLTMWYPSRDLFKKFFYCLCLPTHNM